MEDRELTDLFDDIARDLKEFYLSKQDELSNELYDVYYNIREKHITKLKELGVTIDHRVPELKVLSKEGIIIAACADCPFEGKFSDQECHDCQRQLEAIAQAQRDYDMEQIKGER